MNYNSKRPAFPSKIEGVESGEQGMPYYVERTSYGLTKLEYALIHGNHEPLEDDISLQRQRDKNKNPFNEDHKPPLRSRNEIIRDLKIEYYTTLLDSETK